VATRKKDYDPCRRVTTQSGDGSTGGCAANRAKRPHSNKPHVRKPTAGPAARPNTPLAVENSVGEVTAVSKDRAPKVHPTGKRVWRTPTPILRARCRTGIALSPFYVELPVAGMPLRDLRSVSPQRRRAPDGCRVTVASVGANLECGAKAPLSTSMAVSVAARLRRARFVTKVSQLKTRQRRAATPSFAHDSVLRSRKRCCRTALQIFAWNTEGASMVPHAASALQSYFARGNAAQSVHAPLPCTASNCSSPELHQPA
jgi:hypothetical protein